MTDRSAIHAYLSAEAHARWHDLAESSGVSLTGLLESLSSALPRPAADSRPLGSWETDWDEVVRFARVVDARRRRRKGVRS